MKIIKHGKQEYINATDFKLECPNCGCIFLFDCGDFTWQERKIDGFAGIRCPDCKKEIVFKPSNVLYNEELEDDK